jgi:hypothetical protein
LLLLAISTRSDRSVDHIWQSPSSALLARADRSIEKKLNKIDSRLTGGCLSSGDRIAYNRPRDWGLSPSGPAHCVPERGLLMPRERPALIDRRSGIERSSRFWLIKSYSCTTNSTSRFHGSPRDRWVLSPSEHARAPGILPHLWLLDTEYKNKKQRVICLLQEESNRITFVLDWVAT